MKACRRASLSGLGEDLLVEVFVKVGQNLKALIRLRCVSKSWRRLVNSRCLPRLTCNDPLEFKGYLMKVEFGGLLEIKHPPVLAFTTHRCQGDNHFSEEEAEGGRRLMEKIHSRALIFLDACNGLLLHRLNNNDNPTSPPVYRVSNLETNSWVVVNGEPDMGDTAFCNMNRMNHAVLAYSPAESLMSFKIVAFLRQRCMRIYSSKRGKWSRDLHFDHLLPREVQGLRWIEQSLYLNGAVYRLPVMKYLLRFETDDENCDESCAQAIQLPEGEGPWSFSLTPIHVGIHKGQINLASVPNFYGGLKVWILQEEGHGNNYSSQWILKHHIRKLERPAGLVISILGTTIGPIGFHPYEDIVVLVTVDDFHFRFMCCHLDRYLSVSANYQAIRDALPQDFTVRPYCFPLFSCAVPLR